MNRSFLAALVSGLLLALGSGAAGAQDSLATQKTEAAATRSPSRGAAKSTPAGQVGGSAQGLFGPSGQIDSGQINRTGGELKKASRTIQVQQQPSEGMLGELQSAQSPKADGQGTRTSPGKQQSVATPPQQVQAQGKPATPAKPCKPTASVPVPPGC